MVTQVEIASMFERMANELVELWHKSDDRRPIYDFMGLSMEEYAAWVEQRIFLRLKHGDSCPLCGKPLIVVRHEEGSTLTFYLACNNDRNICWFQQEAQLWWGHPYINYDWKLVYLPESPLMDETPYQFIRREDIANGRATYTPQIPKGIKRVE